MSLKVPPIETLNMYLEFCEDLAARYINSDSFVADDNIGYDFIRVLSIVLHLKNSIRKEYCIHGKLILDILQSIDDFLDFMPPSRFILSIKRKPQCFSVELRERIINCIEKTRLTDIVDRVLYQYLKHDVRFGENHYHTAHNYVLHTISVHLSSFEFLLLTAMSHGRNNPPLQNLRYSRDRLYKFVKTNIYEMCFKVETYFNIDLYFGKIIGRYEELEMLANKLTRGKKYQTLEDGRNKSIEDIFRSGYATYHLLLQTTDIAEIERVYRRAMIEFTERHEINILTNPQQVILVIAALLRTMSHIDNCEKYHKELSDMIEVINSINIHTLLMSYARNLTIDSLIEDLLSLKFEARNTTMKSLRTKFDDIIETIYIYAKRCDQTHCYRSSFEKYLNHFLPDEYEEEDIPSWNEKIADFQSVAFEFGLAHLFSRCMICMVPQVNLDEKDEMAVLNCCNEFYYCVKCIRLRMNPRSGILVNRRKRRCSACSLEFSSYMKSSTFSKYSLSEESHLQSVVNTTENA